MIDRDAMVGGVQDKLFRREIQCDINFVRVLSSCNLLQGHHFTVRNPCRIDDLPVLHRESCEIRRGIARTYIPVSSCRPRNLSNFYSIPSTKEPIQGSTGGVKGNRESSVADSVRATKFPEGLILLGGDGWLFPKPQVPPVYGPGPSQLPALFRGYREQISTKVHWRVVGHTWQNMRKYAPTFHICL